MLQVFRCVEVHIGVERVAPIFAYHVPSVALLEESRGMCLHEVTRFVGPNVAVANFSPLPLLALLRGIASCPDRSSKAKQHHHS